MQVTFELLIDSRKRGGPFAGALFWNAAANFTGDYDGCVGKGVSQGGRGKHAPMHEPNAFTGM